MLHDAMLTRGRTAGDDGPDRRTSLRARCAAEVVIAWPAPAGESPWMEEPAMTCRYVASDVSDGGLRIRSALPLLEGTVGRALKLLPTGRDIDRAVMVAWCRRNDTAGRYEIGLRYF